MLAGLWSTLPFHTSGHGVQLAVVVEPDADGEGDRTWPDVGEAHRAFGGMQPPSSARPAAATANRRSLTGRPRRRPRRSATGAPTARRCTSAGPGPAASA